MPDAFLSNVRINRSFQALEDPRLLPAPLPWVARIPSVNALDGEITMRSIDRIKIADLIQDDQKAVTYSTGNATFESFTAPNLKIGRAMDQAMIRQLRALQQAGTLSGPGADVFLQREARGLMMLQEGIRQRKETLLVGMLTDSYSYSRLGITFTGASWGMPSDLKVTVSPVWTDAANAHPVSDLTNLYRTAQVRYGKLYNRITMSRQAFDYMIATTEFQNKAKLLLPNGITFTNLITQVTANMVALAEAIIDIPGLTIELYDQRYWDQDTAGNETSANYLPINQVIVTNSADDNNPTIWDWANGEVIEPLVQGLGDASQGMGNPGPVYGPYAYAVPNRDANPPSIEYWAVARGWPRKHQIQANACLTVGTFTDSIAVGAPF
jgi:hypothetical protein